MQNLFTFFPFILSLKKKWGVVALSIQGPVGIPKIGKWLISCTFSVYKN